MLKAIAYLTSGGFFRLAYILSTFLFPWLVIGPLGTYFEGVYTRLGLLLILVAGESWLFRRAWCKHSVWTGSMVSLLANGFLFKLASFLPEISSHPFSLGWSEASRYYYASLYLSEKIYGIPLPPSVLHPSRYLMQATPFLLPDSPLWLHRLWQVILWVTTGALTGWLLARRAAAGQPQLTRWALAIWAFLFMFQGPVYYHLLVMVILVLWAYDSRRFWRTLIVVLLASAWAGISRINWLPVPGLLATALYLLEIPLSQQSGDSSESQHQVASTGSDRSPRRIERLFLLIKYLSPPLTWTILGSLVGLAVQQAYQQFSGNPPELFGSSFASDLLWYRLLPNPTFLLGILPSAILVSLPLLGLMVLRLSSTWREAHLIRPLGLGAILLTLFIGGVVVSVKIGGGSNLHNLDAYLVLLMVIGASGYFRPGSVGQVNRYGKFTWKGFYRIAWIEKSLLAAAVAIPLFFTISAGRMVSHRDVTTADSDVQTLRQAAQQVTQNGGEVLFINQRHLLTFGYIEGVPLVADYELVFLMEMAMADNTTYLDAFHADLRAHRFALIVAEPLTVQYQGRSHSFGEENDAWVERVSKPVLCDYEPLTTLETAGVVLYTPRQTPAEEFSDCR